MTHLTPHKAATQFIAAAFDPDSKWLYYLTNSGGEFTRVRRYELATGNHEDVESADWDIPFTRFSRDGRYRVSAVNDDGRTVIRVHDSNTGRKVGMPKLPEGDVTSVVFSRDEQRMVVTLNGDRSPSNLYAARVGSAEATRLTDSLSKDIDPADLVESRVVRFKASDGLSIPSILYKPHHASPENKVPALVWVHGGPGGQTRKGYSASSSTWSTMDMPYWASITAAARATARHISPRTTKSTATNRCALRRGQSVPRCHVRHRPGQDRHHRR